MRSTSVDGPGPRTPNRPDHPSPSPTTPDPAPTPHAPPSRRWTLAVFLAAVAINAPSVGDIGPTWDEPSYRYTQLMSVQWWERLAEARTRDDFAALLDPDALLHYWPYGRFGICFHPPLGPQLNLAAHAAFGGFLKDYPARRMASVIEFAIVLAVLFHLASRTLGVRGGLVAAGALLLQPRVFGDGHVAATDMPGLALWMLAAAAFWRGLNEPRARGARVALGVLLGLAFVQKTAAVTVLLPIAAWLAARALLSLLQRRWTRAAILDALLTLGAMGIPLLLALLELHRLKNILPPPKETVLFGLRLESWLGGWILAVPALVWLLRETARRLRPASPLWGPPRPGLEIVASVAAFAPLIGWLGNPAWWVQTMPRLAHYWALNTDRKGTLPNILILYMGEIYEFSLPWHNAAVLVAVATPAAILVAGLIGLASRIPRLRTDPFARYAILHALALPALRVLDTPAHDGVRLLLPTLAFLALFAAWGTEWLAEILARVAGWGRDRWGWALAAAVLIPSGWQLLKVHPYELSYYNEFVGGPRRAWRNGWELAYWFDAFNGPFVRELNQRFPEGASVSFPNRLSEPPTFLEMKFLGMLRSDVVVGAARPDALTFKWLLTQDAKSNGFSRLLFAMRPWHASRPRALDGARVATVADPLATSRALALAYLADEPNLRSRVAEGRVPAWVDRWAPPLARLFGRGLLLAPERRVHEPAFAWAASDPEDLRAAARELLQAPDPRSPATERARRLRDILARLPETGPDTSNPSWTQLLARRPEALVEAVEILVKRPEAVRAILLHPGYREPEEGLGGWLDAGLPAYGENGAGIGLGGEGVFLRGGGKGAGLQR